MTKTQPTHKKLPAARVGYALPESYDQSGKVIHGWPKHHKGYIPLAVIPCHTPAQAKQIVRAAEFLRLSTEDKVERIRRHLAQNWTGSYEEDARAVLASMGMGGASK